MVKTGGKQLMFDFPPVKLNLRAHAGIFRVNACFLPDDTLKCADPIYQKKKKII